MTESDFPNGLLEVNGFTVCGKTPSPARFWEGHDFSRATKVRKDSGFSPAQSKFGSLGAHRVLLVMLGVALLLGASCKPQAATERSFLPASNQIAGWARTGDIRTFEAADLWKYIDGDVERFLKAGVQRAFTADYKFQNKVDAVVDIYIMGTAEGAEKIFNSEPAVDGKAVPLGDGARLHSQSLVFRKGACLVRIVAYEESAETQQALLQLGQGIELRLAR